MSSANMERKWLITEPPASLPPGGTPEALLLGSCNAVHIFAQLPQLPKHFITKDLKSQMIPHVEN